MNILRHQFILLVISALILPYCCCTEIPSPNDSTDQTISCCATEAMQPTDTTQHKNTRQNAPYKDCDCASHGGTLTLEHPYSVDSVLLKIHANPSWVPLHVYFVSCHIGGSARHSKPHTDTAPSPPLYQLNQNFRI